LQQPLAATVKAVAAAAAAAQAANWDSYHAQRMVIFEVPQSLSKFLSLMIKSYNLKSSDRVLGNALKIHMMSQ
jgi:chorismate mutase